MSWVKVTNPSTDNWTKATNPTSASSGTTTAGVPMGLLLALTYATTSSVPIGSWTKVSNPSSDNWTKVTNPS